MIKGRFAAKALLVILFGVLVGCAATEVAHSAVMPKAAAFTPTYVYVADQEQKALLVYPYGSNVQPSRTIPLAGWPAGVATDSSGNVYVALPSANEVDEFTSGASTVVRTITGVKDPMGVALDAKDDLYVTTECQTPSCDAGFVYEYAPTSNYNVPTAQIQMPKLFGAVGVDIDATGAVWVTARQDVAGAAMRFVNGVWDGTSVQLASADGIADAPTGTLYASSVTMAVQFAPPNYTQSVFAQYGRGNLVRMIGKGPDGSVLFPIQGQIAGVQATGGFGSVVIVYNPGTKTSYTISNGLKSPFGAAAGI